MPRLGEIRLDLPTFAVAVGLTVAVGCIAGLLPALLMRGRDLYGVFRAGGATDGPHGGAGSGVLSTRRWLVAGQVAIAFSLLVAGGLLVASVQNLMAVDLGFASEGVLDGAVLLIGPQYQPQGATVRFVEAAVERLDALPGVEAAAMTRALPLSGSLSSTVVTPEEGERPPG